MSERRITQVVELALGALFTSDRDNESDDRRHHRARASAQRWRAKKNGPQAIGDHAAD
jgi:hypothetical protein